VSDWSSDVCSSDLDRLFVDVHNKQREIGGRCQRADDHHQGRRERSQHHFPPSLLFCNWSSGSRGTTDWPPLLSRITLSVPPSTRSMVSRYMRLRVTSGAFLYSSYPLRKRAVCPVASATVCSR